MKPMTRIVQAALACAAAALAAACGYDNNNYGYCDFCGGTIGYNGMITGLPTGASVTLQDNVGATTSISGNGTFSLSTSAPPWFTALLGVLIEPAGLDCAVSNGVVNSSGIVPVTISCTATAATTLMTDFAGMVLVGSADGPGTSATFNDPKALAIDNLGNFFVADTDNSTIRSITAVGNVSTLAGTAGNFGAIDATGAAASFNRPYALAFDPSGTGYVYVADTGNNTIRRIAPGAVVTTSAGAAGVAGSADGPGASARFSGPAGIAVDGAGNVYIADYYNNTIRKFTPGTGAVTTIAGAAGAAGSGDGLGALARFNGPRGLALDAAGANLYVADSGNYTIRQLTLATGAVSTIAGTAGISGSADGAANAATFGKPIGVAVDGGGNVYVADFFNSTVRKLTVAGTTYTVATVIGVPGQAVFDAGILPASLEPPESLVLSGTSLYLITNGGVAQVVNTP